MGFYPSNRASLGRGPIVSSVFRPNRLEGTQWLSTEHGDQEAR